MESEKVDQAETIKKKKVTTRKPSSETLRQNLQRRKQQAKQKNKSKSHNNTQT